MNNCNKRERCPYEDTERCITCNPDKHPDPVEITLEKAIDYFIEENEGLRNTAGERVKDTIEYRINQLAIQALQEKQINEVFK